MLGDHPDTWDALEDKFKVLCKPRKENGPYFVTNNIAALSSSLTEMTQYDYPHHSY